MSMFDLTCIINQWSFANFKVHTFKLIEIQRNVAFSITSLDKEHKVTSTTARFVLDRAGHHVDRRRLISIYLYVKK